MRAPTTAEEEERQLAAAIALSLEGRTDDNHNTVHSREVVVVDTQPSPSSNLMSFEDPNHAERQKVIRRITQLYDSPNCSHVSAPSPAPPPQSPPKRTISVPQMMFAHFAHTGGGGIPRSSSSLLPPSHADTSGSSACDQSTAKLSSMGSARDVFDDSVSIVTTASSSQHSVDVPFRPKSYFHANGDLIDFGAAQNVADLSIDDFDPMLQQRQQQKQRREQQQLDLQLRRPTSMVSSSSGDTTASVQLRRSLTATTPPAKPLRRKLTQPVTVAEMEKVSLPVGRTAEDGTLRLRHRPSVYASSVLNGRRELASSVGGNSNKWRGVVCADTQPESYVDDMEVKVVINVRDDSRHAQFTCRTTSPIHVILIEARSRLQLDDVEEEGRETLSVHGTEELLLPEHTLRRYVYVRQCISFDRDIRLTITEHGLDDQGSSTLEDFVAAPMTELTPFCAMGDVQTMLDACARDMERVRHRDAPSSQAVQQCVKALCTMLSHIQPDALMDSIDEYARAAELFLQKITNDPYDLDCCASKLLTNVRSLIRLYSKCSSCDYEIEEEGECPPSTSSSPLQMSHSVIAKLCVAVQSVYRVPPHWVTQPSSQFLLSLEVSNGCAPLGKQMLVRSLGIRKAFHSYIRFAHTITFDVNICSLPREARLCVVLYSQSTATDGSVRPQPLGWTSIPLFDANTDVLISGDFVASLCTSERHFKVMQPWGGDALITSSPSTPVVHMTLKTGKNAVVYPPPMIMTDDHRTSAVFDSLDGETQQIILDAIDTQRREGRLAGDDMDVLWEKRHYLRGVESALSLVLASAPSHDWACIAHTHQLLTIWTPLSAQHAIQLLLPQYSDLVVRRTAIEWLSREEVDGLAQLLPQLVEALRFETAFYSPLAQLLLANAYNNRRFAFKLFWQLHQRCVGGVDVVPFACVFTLMREELLALIGRQFAERTVAQLRLVEQLDSVGAEVKVARDSQIDTIVRRHMDKLDSSLLQSHARLPLQVGFPCTGVRIQQCSVYASLTKPIKVMFRGISPDVDYGVINKLGDDLRQDALVLQMMSAMNVVWLGASVDLRMIVYDCLPTSSNRGLIELVPNCDTLLRITGLQGVFKDDRIHLWLQKHNDDPLKMERALVNFQRSCAGWCVGTYVLGIGDRHNDNILLTNTGHVFHIDFGKWLGDWQRVAGISRDRVPFVLTSAMVYVINKGSDKSSVQFQEFIDLCCEAFNCIRRNHQLFINLLRIMICAGIPGVEEKAIQFVTDRLWLQYSDVEATSEFSQLIRQSAESLFPKLNFGAHAWVQRHKLGNELSNDHKLSFAPKIVNEKTGEQRIERVRVESVHKYRDPDKVYRYRLCVEREHVNVPHRVNRSYAEFVELHDKLRRIHPHTAMFPLPNGRTLLTRSNIEAVAVRRQRDVHSFVQSLFEHGLHRDDLVYTFFHPLYRDVHIVEADEENNNSLDTSLISGRIKLRIECRNNRLNVIVGHVQNLSTARGVPSPYVKCYMRSVHRPYARHTKRKTRIVSKSTMPTYNDILHYAKPSVLSDWQLEVTVWHYETVNQNVYLGGTLIGLQQLEAKDTIDEWFALRDVFSV